MELSMIEQIVLTYSPMIVTIIGIITSFVKMCSIIKDVKNTNTTEREELSNLCKSVMIDNERLKKSINELTTQITKIKHGE